MQNKGNFFFDNAKLTSNFKLNYKKGKKHNLFCEKGPLRPEIAVILLTFLLARRLSLRHPYLSPSVLFGTTRFSLRTRTHATLFIWMAQFSFDFAIKLRGWCLQVRQGSSEISWHWNSSNILL